MHSHQRTDWWKEGLISLGTGILYGASNTLVGHPFDTVKSKMQAQAGFLSAKDGGGGMTHTLKQVYAKEGFRGFYRGVIPPLWGSALYRSCQFAMFEALYTSMDNPSFRTVIPHTGGLEVRTVLAGFCGASARSLLESPIEYAKVNRQTGQTWHFRNLYQGYFFQWGRTAPMMTTYFVLFDTLRRNTSLLTHPVGQFLASGGCSTLAFWLTWPMETLKNQVQAGTRIGAVAAKDATIAQRVAYMGGFLGLYRGIVPGTISIFSRNGSAMVVMQYAQAKITEWGWRN
mmetsp:Transcript_39593/g.99799  ORF Transcript_39593/g.99799 Transcript_39593/m.99799 type:complete len:286 (+) Transcript_39593:128-985(+)|eukprot:CAMPEP_0177668248 /NCGR_PEP_ID=MMETSP0447-20121125/22644_1 /TAXON_ID=0 /ORGANISM="Stygamoeba regulata, Strain BSH-02190019" /LENGTH=285 /DNA_ID=CAMNT_0019174711 /DNA_START=24 /DNA_END=881 /DNA_ORIENTATION=-